MITWYGSGEECLHSGEYDQGDYVQVPYDELYDLVEQMKLICSELSFCDHCTLADEHGPESLRTHVERKSNRPLHPCLGGKSPYTGYLPL